MKKNDLRKLTKEEQRILRLKATEAVIKRKLTQVEVSRAFGLSEQLVSKWIKIYKKKGWQGLEEDKRGKGKPKSKLSKRKKEKIAKIIEEQMPNEFGLPYLLWCRGAVKELIKKKYKMKLSDNTVGEILKDYGFTVKKPTTRSIEQDSEEVRKWKETEYPKIAKEARKTGSEIYWVDESGLQSNCNNIRGYAKKGKKPLKEKTGKRFRVNMISGVSNKGDMKFMVFKGKFKSELFIDFLRRLINSIKGKVLVIADNYSVHKSKKVREWLEKNKDRIRIEFLPKYSPELNPDELLNQDLKANGIKNKIIESRETLKTEMIRYLRKIQANKEKVKNYFKKDSVSYAKA